MKVKIGYIQLAASTNQEENFLRTVDKIEKLAQKGTQIICTQELFLSPYFCNEESKKHFDLAKPIPNQETNILAKLAKELNIVIIASFFEKTDDQKHYNTTILFDTEGKTNKYRKTHIPYDPDYYEKYYFEKGDLGYQVFNTKHGKIAPLICFDQWFPEAARAVALKGAQLIVYPTAIGWDKNDTIETQKEELSAWKTIQQAHAIANGVYIMSVNRVGNEKNTQFWGNSFISNPFGKIVQQARETEEVNFYEIDYEKISTYRKTWAFLRDRRPETYNSISQTDNDDL